jgi:hypothetical protein
MNEVMKTYRPEDLENLSEEALLGLLKSCWGYSATQPLDIIGRLQIVETQTGISFFNLHDLHSINDGSILTYPLEGVRQVVYLGRINQKIHQNRSLDEQWVKARVHLSPQSERIKHKNLLGLKVTDGSWELLRELPKDVSNNLEVLVDGKSHIEEWVIDFYRRKNSEQIRKDADALSAELVRQREKENAEVLELQNEVLLLTERVTQNTELLQTTEEQLSATLGISRQAETEFEGRKKTMERQLDDLSQFIEQKANILVKMDLLSEKDVAVLLGRPDEIPTQGGHNFAVEFDSDPRKAVSFIQAYMRNRNIVYARTVLEDFYALLTTHDLIVLAGDSGSGKTNLVKSFAEAIGGKAVIVPVKPNWTSAEDLLGYYNPLEQKYISTPFLDALHEASKNPDRLYFICLDEMNLARVEYYFADFLSLLEERGQLPEIHLFSDAEEKHLVSETRNFLALIDDARLKLDKISVQSFLDLMRDEELNAKLHELCGFREGDSLLKYHAHLRRMLSSFLDVPSKLRFPSNVRIIGTVNVDETTHYLSPKILDRAHIMKFSNPLLADWELIDTEVVSFDLDLNTPLTMSARDFGERADYPSFDRDDELVKFLMGLVKKYLDPLGIEFGLRTVRQARHYSIALRKLGASDDLILNNIILHKILPKLMFDGQKDIGGDVTRKDKLLEFKDHLEKELSGLKGLDNYTSCTDELDHLIRNARSNDWVVNYWSR